MVVLCRVTSAESLIGVNILTETEPVLAIDKATKCFHTGVIRIYWLP